MLETNESINIGWCMYHITWIGDPHVLDLPKHKDDQEGKNAYPKHVYTNSNVP